MMIFSQELGFTYREDDYKKVWLAILHNHPLGSCDGSQFLMAAYFLVGGTSEEAAQEAKRGLGRGWEVVEIKPLQEYLSMLKASADKTPIL